MPSDDLVEDIMKELGIDKVEIFSYPCKNEKFSKEEVNEIFKSYLEKKEKLWNLRKESFKIDGKIAALKFEIFEILKENQVLSFNLSGLVSQYITLNKIKNSKEIRKNQEIDELIERYMVLSEFKYE
ncbi:MAG: hypothetical protein RXO36_03845 [Candidatus Nanopusillus acidilobi]